MKNNSTKSISRQQMIEAVSTHEVFNRLDKQSLGQLSGILDYHLIEKNQRVFEVGDQPNLIFYLLSGSLTLKFPDNTKLELQPGELIGEIGVLNGDFRLGALTANEESQLISICGSSLFKPEVIPTAMSLQIVRNLSKRVTNYLRSIQQTSTREIIAKGENDHVEFKSTLRWNIKAQKKDPRITHAVLKTIAAFLNTEGGILLVGVTDDGDLTGLGDDNFQNHDKLFLFLTNIIKSQLGPFQMDKIHFHIEPVDEHEVLRIDVQAASNPCYLISDKLDHFYIRTGPATTDLRLSKVYDYITKRYNTKTTNDEN